jgi:carbonic anhydrase/acetyltransferase-like protein (isoleucine patch superfamily)
MFIEYNGKTPRVAASAFIAPTAVLIGDVEVGDGASIWFGAVLRGDNGPITVGARSNVQDNAVVHVSGPQGTHIEEDVTVGHGAIMEDCVIKRGALIGTRATILNGATVGECALIGAGSVVAANDTIPPRVLAAGTPASVRKPLEGPALTWVEEAGPHYVHHSRSYLKEGIGDPDMHEVLSTPSTHAAQ